MKKSQYDKVKKYRFKRTKVFSIKNMTRVAVIVTIFCSVGYSYWNSTLHISGTVTIAGTQPAPTEYNPDNLVEGTNTFEGSPGKPTVTVENGVVKEYTFTDTSGVDINANPIDTGFLPFTNGKKFELSITVNSFTATDNRPTGGILFGVSDGTDSNFVGIGYATNANYAKAYAPPTYTTGKNFTINSSPVTLTMTYSSGRLTIKNGNATVLNINTSINIENMRLLIGYKEDSNGNITRQAVATITQFSVREI